MSSNSKHSQMFTIRMDEKMHNDLRKLSFLRVQSMTETIRLAINDYMAQEENKRLLNKRKI